MNKKTFVNTKRVPSGRVVVSTVALPDWVRIIQPFETMVFEAHTNTDEVLSYSDLDAKFYEDESEAASGHDSMIKKWSA